MHDNERTKIMVAADLPRGFSSPWSDFTARSAPKMEITFLSNSASFFPFPVSLKESKAFVPRPGWH